MDVLPNWIQLDKTGIAHVDTSFVLPVLTCCICESVYLDTYGLSTHVSRIACLDLTYCPSRFVYLRHILPMQTHLTDIAIYASVGRSFYSTLFVSKGLFCGSGFIYMKVSFDICTRTGCSRTRLPKAAKESESLRLFIYG